MRPLAALHSFPSSTAFPPAFPGSKFNYGPRRVAKKKIFAPAIFLRN